MVVRKRATTAKATADLRTRRIVSWISIPLVGLLAALYSVLDYGGGCPSCPWITTEVEGIAFFLYIGACGGMMISMATNFEAFWKYWVYNIVGVSWYITVLSGFSCAIYTALLKFWAYFTEQVDKYAGIGGVVDNDNGKVKVNANAGVLPFFIDLVKRCPMIQNNRVRTVMSWGLLIVVIIGCGLCWILKVLLLRLIWKIGDRYAAKNLDKRGPGRPRSVRASPIPIKNRKTSGSESESESSSESAQNYNTHQLTPPRGGSPRSRGPGSRSSSSSRYLSSQDSILTSSRRRGVQVGRITTSRALSLPPVQMETLSTTRRSERILEKQKQGRLGRRYNDINI